MNAKIIGAGLAVALSAAGIVGTQIQTVIPEESSELVQYQIKCAAAQDWHSTYVLTSTNGRMAFTDGEAYRPPETASLYARLGKGIAASLHTQRLARDKMLFVDGKYSPNGEDYAYAGKVWEAIGPAFGVNTAWGGRFNDANHFSCAWGGRK